MIIIDESKIDSNGYFCDNSYYVEERNRYEFKENVVITGDCIFKKSVYVAGNQRVEGDQLVAGDQMVEGYRIIRGYKLYRRGSITVNHIGSRSSNSIFYFTKNDGIYVKCGCFFGSITEFEKNVYETHNNNKYSKEYKATIDYVRSLYANIQDE